MSGLLYHLEYKLECDDWDISFENSSTVKWEPGPFSLLLANGIASIEMNERFPSDGQARNRVEPFLRSWEILTIIERGSGQFKFGFQSAKISERETSTWRPPGAIHVSQMAVEVLMSRPPRLREYPRVPTAFLADDDVLLMWQRFLGYRKDPNQLATVGYFCFTVAVGRAGSVPDAATLYNIDARVLKKLSELTSTRGSRTVARKYGGGRFRGHTKDERRWIDAVILQIILRVGHLEGADPPNSRLTMDDLPSL